MKKLAEDLELDGDELDERDVADDWDWEEEEKEERLDEERLDEEDIEDFSFWLV